MAKDLEAEYRHFNTTYFDGALPRVKVKWRNGLLQSKWSAYGVAWWDTEDNPYEIQIDSVLKNYLPIASLTLLHEMCHFALPYGYGHGPKFHNKMKQLAVKGAMNDLW